MVVVLVEELGGNKYYYYPPKDKTIAFKKVIFKKIPMKGDFESLNVLVATGSFYMR